MKIRACFIVLLLVFLAGCSDSKSIQDDSKPVHIVKAGKLNNCSQPTMEKAINRIFPSPQWTSEKAAGNEKGDSVVYVRGTLQFKGQDAKAELRFIVDQQTGVFDITGFTLNGVEQSHEITTAFFARACQ